MKWDMQEKRGGIVDVSCSRKMDWKAVVMSAMSSETGVYDKRGIEAAVSMCWKRLGRSRL